jgi:hypothetical protein
VHPKAERDGPDLLTRAPRADGGNRMLSPASRRVYGIGLTVLQGAVTVMGGGHGQ